MTPERRLWQDVVLRALMDATHPAGDEGNSEDARGRRSARQWLREGGKDFRTVCNLAGLDPDFVREKYLAGKICGEALRSMEKAKP